MAVQLHYFERNDGTFHGCGPGAGSKAIAANQFHIITFRATGKYEETLSEVGLLRYINANCGLHPFDIESLIGWISASEGASFIHFDDLVIIKMW